MEIVQILRREMNIRVLYPFQSQNCGTLWFEIVLSVSLKTENEFENKKKRPIGPLSGSDGMATDGWARIPDTRKPVISDAKRSLEEWYNLASRMIRFRLPDERLLLHEFLAILRCHWPLDERRRRLQKNP
jgi:hypothetical protein